MLEKHRKNDPIKEHRKKRVKHDPSSKIKARGESQSKECLEKTQKYSTHLHISIKLHD
jgi:hypothetical protein